MTTMRMVAQKLLDKYHLDPPEDFVREMLELLINSLMQAEVTALVGAEPYERSAERTTWRNGTRSRAWDTRAGTIDLAIPKLREGNYFPSFLDARRRGERALMAVVQEAYVTGVSTRKVERLVQSLGIEGLSKSQVSRICSELDATVEAWRTRPIEEEIAYLFLDATFPKVRQDSRVTSKAAVVAIGVTSDGQRRILGVDVGASETGAFWLAFLRSLVARGLSGVQLVISDAHEGLTSAIDAVLAGAAWQRCRVHFMRNVLGQVTKADAPWVVAMIRSIFVQTSPESTRAQYQAVIDGLKARQPKVAAMLEDAEEALLAFTAFPQAHWRQIWSTNPLERLNREIKRRIDVVGIFPNDAAVVRLVGALLMEQDDEWLAGRRYFSTASMEPLRAAPTRLPVSEEIM